MKKITIKEVAAKAKVSLALVSFVMNNERAEASGMPKKYSVNPDTERHIKAVAESLGYRPNSSASFLRTGKRNTIGVIIPNIANSFYASIARTIESIVSAKGYLVLFASTDESEEKLSMAVESMLDHNVDGLIVTPCVGANKSLYTLAKCGISTVLVDRNIPGEGFGRVMLDNISATSMAVKHLYSKGIQKIELINYDIASSCNEDREIGYRKAMKDLGLTPKIHYISNLDSEKETNLRESIVDMISRDVRGLILPTNTISDITVRLLASEGILDKFDIVSFDISAPYRVMLPHIAQINQDPIVIAQNTCNLLFSMIAGETSGKSIIINPSMVCNGETIDIEAEDISTMEDRGKFDFVVVGAGNAGICAAVAAARSGAKVALIEKENVLGGENSSLGRIGLKGRMNIGAFPSLGYLLNEFAPSFGGDGREGNIYEDEKKLRIVTREHGITLLRGCVVEEIVKSSQRKIASILGRDSLNGNRFRLSGDYFCDATGNATLGVLCEATVVDSHILGDVLLHGEDTAQYEDSCVCLGDSLRHIPLRCLYSRDIENLFCVGSNISVGEEVKSRPAALTGEVVGLVAAICGKNNIAPQEVFPTHWGEVAEALSAGAGRTNVAYSQVYDVSS